MQAIAHSEINLVLEKIISSKSLKKMNLSSHTALKTKRKIMQEKLIILGMNLIHLDNPCHHTNQMETYWIYKTKVYSKDRVPSKAHSAKIINFKQFSSLLILISP
jgi:predicted small secreted protein